MAGRDVRPASALRAFVDGNLNKSVASSCWSASIDTRSPEIEGLIAGSESSTRPGALADQDRELGRCVGVTSVADTPVFSAPMPALVHGENLGQS